MATERIKIGLLNGIFVDEFFINVKKKKKNDFNDSIKVLRQYNNLRVAYCNNNNNHNNNYIFSIEHNVFNLSS